MIPPNWYSVVSRTPQRICRPALSDAKQVQFEEREASGIVARQVLENNAAAPRKAVKARRIATPR